RNLVRELCGKSGPFGQAEVLHSEQGSRLFRTLAVQSLTHVLKANHFSRIGGAELQGSGPILEDWRPRIWKETFDYWREAFDRLTTVALGKDDLAMQARDGIADSIRGLVRTGAWKIWNKQSPASLSGMAHTGQRRWKR
ncbi:MAG: hypothetical protein HY670_03050, partial [Chloroflexi bacterium]|nr:hypothetical protein [Chloroflexota bacterium]